MAGEEDSYLTRAQQLEEDYRLAPGGPAAAGQRVSENLARIAASNAQNPLLTPPDSGLATVAVGQPATTPVTDTAVQPNPMIRPPAAFNMMPVEKQIKWRALAVQQQADQDAQEKRTLDLAVSKSANDLRLEQVKQGNEFMKDLPRLQALLATGKTTDYANLRSELVSKHPLAMGAEEVQNAIKSFDENHAKLVGFEENRSKAETAVKEKVLQKRIDDGFEMVKPLGPEASQRYAAMVAQNPEKAIEYATSIAAPAMRENAITNLKAAGFTDDEIARYGTGPEFKYQAADQAAKSRAALSTEKNKARQEWLALDKERAEARFDPNKPNAYAVTHGKWNPDKEEAHKQAFAYWDSLTPKIRDPRAGIAGMSTEYYPYQREQQAAIARTLPATTPVATRPPVQPTVPVRPGAPPQRVPVTQQRIQPTPTPVATTSAAAPKPTPAPPPLNPAYPEHWVGGKRYIQMPDGKLYLSKVQ